MTFPSVRLDKVFDIARGGSPRPIDEFITDDPDGIPWIMISDASASSKYIASTKKRIRPEGEIKSRRVQSGDFLLSNSMSFGRPYIMRTSGCIHDGWLVLRPKEEVSSDFFYHLLGSPNVFKEFERRAAGATVKNLNIDLVSGVEIPLPPLEEQRRIAEVLDRVDALRQKRRLAIQKLDTLLQSVFLDMFGDPATNPRGWKSVSMSSIVEGFRYGTSNKSGLVGYPTLRIPNIVGGSVDLSDLKTVHVTDDEFKRLQLRADDVLFVRTNGNPDYVGRCAIFRDSAVGAKSFSPDEYIFASYLIRARLDHSAVDPNYLQTFLSTAEGRARLRAKCKTSAGQYNINTEGLGSIVIMLPELAHQRRFRKAAFEIAEYRRSLVQYEGVIDRLFCSLQARAFDGSQFLCGASQLASAS